MNLNPENYGTREACQALYDAGIVVETDALWHINPFLNTATLVSRTGFYGDDRIDKENHIPALNMAEAWRELPDDTWILRGNGVSHAAIQGRITKTSQTNANPVDALIYLRIWIEGQKKEAT